MRHNAIRDDTNAKRSFDEAGAPGERQARER
jgi:hypothetical protein